MYTNKKNQPAAIAYIGKQSKPYFHYRFVNESQRAAHVEEFFASMKQTFEFKQARETEKAQGHSIKVNDVLYASWGYDQTNIQFFQVVAVKGSMVTFREIAQNMVEGSAGFMCESVTARRDSFLSKEFTRRANGRNHVTFAKSKGGYKLHLSAYDGRPLYQSHYA